jgi:hypothetical protein
VTKIQSLIIKEVYQVIIEGIKLQATSKSICIVFYYMSSICSFFYICLLINASYVLGSCSYLYFVTCSQRQQRGTFHRFPIAHLVDVLGFVYPQY